MLLFAAGFVIALFVTSVLWWNDVRRRRHFLRYVGEVLQTVRYGAYHARVTGYVGKTDGPFASQVNEMVQSLTTQIERLSEERDVLRHILQSMTTGVVYIGQNGRIRMINEAAQMIVLRPMEQCLGAEYEAVIRHFGIRRAIEQAMMTGGQWRSEIQLRENLSIEVQLVPLHADSTLRHGQRKPYSVLLLCTDISQWRRLEQMRTDFVANVSHELKTPITAIRGFAETLLDGNVDEDTTRSFLGVIHEESLRMGNLVSDLLTLSKLEGTGETFKPQAVHFAELIESVAQRVGGEAQKRNLSLVMEPAGSLTMWGDPEQLLQVLLNLVVNAMHYTPAGGEVKVWHEVQPESVKVHVSDTGVGIPQEHQSRVFERFYRVDRDRSRATGGTGLGLAIVKHIVTVHGGEVGLSSEVGVGSDFWFTLPRVGKTS